MKSKILVKEKQLIFSYNKTEQSKTSTYFPKSEDEVKFLLKNDLKIFCWF